MAGRPLVHAAENMAAEKGGRIAPRLVFRLLGRRSLVHGIGHAYGFPSFLSPAPAVPPTDPWEVIWLQNAFCSCSQPWRHADALAARTDVQAAGNAGAVGDPGAGDRKSKSLNSSH